MLTTIVTSERPLIMPQLLIEAMIHTTSQALAITIQPDLPRGYSLCLFKGRLLFMFQPGLEHERVPQGGCPIHRPGEMLAPLASDEARIEESLVFQPLLVQ